MNDDGIMVLDLRGLKCPMPVLKASKAIKAMPVSQQVWLETTDPLAVIDIPAFCNEQGHDLLQTVEADGFNRFLVQKNAG